MPWNVWLSTEMIIHHVLHSSLCKRLLNRSDYYVMLAFLDFRTSFQIGSLTFCCTFPSRKLEILTFRVEWNAVLAPIMQDEVRNAFIQTVLRQLGQGGGSHPPCVSALMEISTLNCIPSQPFVAEQDLSSAPSCVSHSLKLWRNKKGNQKPTSKPFGIEGHQTAKVTRRRARMVKTFDDCRLTTRDINLSCLTFSKQQCLC